MKRNIHVLHVPISLPLMMRRSAGTYLVDLVEALHSAAGLDAGMLHVNPVSIPSLFKHKLKNRLCENSLKNISIKQVGNRYPLRSINKRNSPDWRRYMMNSFNAYCKNYGVPDIIHAHSGRGAGEVALDIHRAFGTPYLVQEHNPVYMSGQLGEGEKERLRAVYANASYICPVSMAMAPIIKSLAVSDDKVEVVPNLISPVFESASSFDIARKTKLQVTIVARLEKNKNVQMGIRAFAKVAESTLAELNIIGIGGLREELSALVRELGIEDRVNFLGYQDKKMFAPLLSSSEALLLSTYQEPFGVPVVEALFCGCPVIATRSGGPEEIAAAVDGISLVNCDDVGNMANILSSALKSPITPSQREALSEKAKTVYGSNAIISKWISIYNDLLSQAQVNFNTSLRS